MSLKGKDRFYRDSRDDEKRYLGPMLRFEEQKYLNSRIIVSNIDDRVIRETLEDKFTRYGRVLGVSMHRGFAYVQFENEISASSAIKSENDTLFSGNKIDVRLAKFSRKEEKPKFLPIQAGRRRVSPPRRESNALRDNYNRSSYRDRSPDKSDSYRKDSFRSRSRSPKRDMDDRSDNKEVSKTNHCEIIVFDKSQSRVYAEIVEWKLKSMGMQVDILFPKPDSPLVDILEDIGSRGSLYAIVVSPQNAAHRSVTVNILHGDLQEHRNMPMDGAMELIAKNFENYKNEDSRNKNSAQDLTRNEIQQLLRELAEGKQIPLLQLDKVIHHLQEYREFLLSTDSEKQNPDLNRSQGPSNIPSQPQNQSSSSAPTEAELRKKLLDLLGGNNSALIGGGLGFPQQQQQQQQLNQNRAKTSQFSDARYEENYSNSSSSMDRNRGFDQQAPSQFNPNSLPESSNKLSPGINLENPEVKRALDALMQGSGAKILQNIEASANAGGVGMTAARASANLGNAGRGNILVGGGNMGSGGDNMGPVGGSMGPVGGNMGLVGHSGGNMVGGGGKMIGGVGNMGVGGVTVASGSGYLPPQQQKLPPISPQQQQHQQFYGGQPTSYNYGMGTGLAGPGPGLNNYAIPGMGIPSLLGMQNVRQPMQQQQQQPNPYNNRPFY